MAQLTAYWIESPTPHAPLGFGVTARSLEDALAIIRTFGYAKYLADDIASLRITAGITIADLDQPHVIASMGPIVARGLWYPFVGVGVPRWADD